MIALLTASLFEKCLLWLSDKKEIPFILTAAFLIFLLSNQISKAFFWTSHQQLFNIFCPLFCLKIGLNRRSLFTTNHKQYSIIIFCGLLVLLYGSFWLLLPTILYSYYMYKKSLGDVKQGRLLLAFSRIIALFLLPTMVWLTFLKANGVAFYSYEVEHYRQFVWIMDAFNASIATLMHSGLENTINFFATFKQLLLYSCFLLFSLLFIYRGSLRFEESYDQFGRGLLTFIILSFIPFFWLLGYYADRLTFSIAPLLVIFIGYLALKQKQENTNLLWLSSSILWQVYNITSYGPFS